MDWHPPQEHRHGRSPSRTGRSATFSGIVWQARFAKTLVRIAIATAEIGGDDQSDHHDYTAQRYSPLNQINRTNVKGLRVAWTMALGGVEGGGILSHGGLEGTPMASGHSGRIPRPYTWLHPTRSLKCQILLAPRAPSIHGPDVTCHGAEIWERSGVRVLA
jgi:hypothetical protein